MAVHIGPHGLFASCIFFKDCTYTESLEHPQRQSEELEGTPTPAQRRWEPSSKKETKKGRRLFLLRYSVSGSEFWDSYFLTLEEHLPGGTINQYELTIYTELSQSWAGEGAY
jgi:hypothetical protein